MSKKYWIVLSVFVVLLSVFTFTDLSIAKSIYSPSSIFGKIFQVIGEFPIYLGFLLFGVTSYNLVKKDSLKVLSALLTFVGVVLLFMMPFRYFGNFTTLTVIILSLVIIVFTFIIIYYSSYISKEFYQRIYTVALIYFITCCVSFVLVTCIKTVAGRMRFVNFEGDYSLFTRWYQFQGITGHASFPSGHTNSASSILCLNLLPLFFSFKKKDKIILYTCTSLFVASTALSRMLLGMHFASDVLCGFMISYTIKEVSTVIIYNYRQKKSIAL